MPRKILPAGPCAYRMARYGCHMMKTAAPAAPLQTAAEIKAQIAHTARLFHFDGQGNPDVSWNASMRWVIARLTDDLTEAEEREASFAAIVAPKATDVLGEPEAVRFARAFSDVRTRRGVAVTADGRQVPLTRVTFA